MKRFKWIFNSFMIWGAVLGFVIFTSLGTIRDTWRHRGAGYVTYDEPERTERVAEGQYKRHNYVMGGFMLALGLSLWVVVAKSARDDSKKPQAGCEPDAAPSNRPPAQSSTSPEVQSPDSLRTPSSGGCG